MAWNFRESSVLFDFLVDLVHDRCRWHFVVLWNWFACFLLLQSSPFTALMKLTPVLFMIVFWCVTSLLAPDPLYSLQTKS